MGDGSVEVGAEVVRTSVDGAIEGFDGVGDPIAKPDWQAKLFTGLGTEDRQWVIIPNSDHAAHLEHPGRFVEAVLGFLERDG